VATPTKAPKKKTPAKPKKPSAHPTFSQNNTVRARFLFMYSERGPRRRHP
jgi:hypothetical protein